MTHSLHCYHLWSLSRMCCYSAAVQTPTVHSLTYYGSRLLKKRISCYFWHFIIQYSAPTQYGNVVGNDGSVNPWI